MSSKPKRSSKYSNVKKKFVPLDFAEQDEYKMVTNPAKILQRNDVFYPYQYLRFAPQKTLINQHDQIMNNMEDYKPKEINYNQPQQSIEEYLPKRTEVSTEKFLDIIKIKLGKSGKNNKKNIKPNYMENLDYFKVENLIQNSKKQKNIFKSISLFEQDSIMKQSRDPLKFFQKQPRYNKDDQELQDITNQLEKPSLKSQNNKNLQDLIFRSSISNKTTQAFLKVLNRIPENNLRNILQENESYVNKTVENFSKKIHKQYPSHYKVTPIFNETSFVNTYNLRPKSREQSAEKTIKKRAQTAEKLRNYYQGFLQMQKLDQIDLSISVYQNSSDHKMQNTLDQKQLQKLKQKKQLKDEFLKSFYDSSQKVIKNET